jgi:hypothetical protein
MVLGYKKGGRGSGKPSFLIIYENIIFLRNLVFLIPIPLLFLELYIEGIIIRIQEGNRR